MGYTPSAEDRREIVLNWLRKNPLRTVMVVWGELQFEEFMGGPDPEDPFNLHGPIGEVA